jgi:hypothetical protein
MVLASDILGNATGPAPLQKGVRWNRQQRRRLRKIENFRDRVLKMLWSAARESKINRRSSISLRATK